MFSIFKTKIKLFRQVPRWELVALLLVLLAALFLRLYRISEYMTFLGDEGRDVRVVQTILHGHLVMIGPQTSIGNMYLGPLYYYMMAPALFLSNLNPVGPAIMVALLSVVTIFLVWRFGRSWFNPATGLIAALLFALSPVAIIYSRSSWNPNPEPFFALLAVWGIWRVWRTKTWPFLMLTGVSLAFALQMHYLGLLLMPTIGFFWLLAVREAWKKKETRTQAIRYSLISLLLFLFLMSPLVLFDLKHQGMNLKAFQAFFADRQTTVNLNPGRSDRLWPIVTLVTSELVLSRTEQYTLAFSIGLLLCIGMILVRRPKKPALWLLLAWLGFGILGLSLYKQHVYAHYLGFLFPAIFLLVGFLLSQIISGKTIGKILGLVILGWLVGLSFKNSPLQFAPNRQLQRTQAVADLVIKESSGEPFNFGLIAKQNYDESYRYFLELNKAKLKRGEDGITKQLFVICEDQDTCQPLNNPQWQIAVFGPAKIDKQWNIDGIKVYRMLHSQ